MEGGRKRLQIIKWGITRRWDKTKRRKKQPYRFTMKDDSIFAFPAIYDEPDTEGVTPPKHPALVLTRRRTGILTVFNSSGIKVGI
jgi:putative SOS response-associated peptidase YedK